MQEFAKVAAATAVGFVISFFLIKGYTKGLEAYECNKAKPFIAEITGGKATTKFELYDGCKIVPRG